MTYPVIGVLMTCATAWIAEALLLASGQVSFEVPSWDGDSTFGFLGDAFEFLGEAFVFAYQFLTFQILGLPWYIGNLILIGCTGTVVVWIAMTTRGVSPG